MRIPRHALQTRAVIYFREVARVGSISGAAANLFVAPSAISRQLDMLESEVGGRVFDRGRHGASPTPLGVALLEHVETSSKHLEELLGKAAGDHNEFKGSIRISAVEGVMGAALPRMVRLLTDKHPLAKLCLDIVGSNDVADRIAAGEADIGVTFGPPARSDIRVIARVPAPLGLVVGVQHPLSMRESVDVRDLQGVRAALPTRSFGIRQELDRAIHEAGVELGVTVEGNQLAMLAMAVAHDNIVTFLPQLALAALHSESDVRFVPIRNSRLNATQLSVITDLRGRMSPLVGVALDELVQVLESLTSALA